MDDSQHLLWSRRPLVLVLALGLVLRLVAALLLTVGQPVKLFEYGVVAHIVLKHGFYGFDFHGFAAPQPDAFIPPLYPLLIAGLMVLSPHQYLVLLALIQCALSLWGCLLAFQLADALWSDKRLSLLAALISALHFPFVAFVGLGATGMLDVVLLQAALTYGVRGIRRDSGHDLALAGLWTGLAVLTRTPALLILPALLAGLLVSRHAGWRRAQHALILCMAVGFCLLPWVLRNFTLYGVPVLSTNGGYNFYVGNGPGASGEFVAPPDALMRQAALLPELERDRLFYYEALAFIQAEPAAWIKVLGHKLYQLVWFRPNLGSMYTHLGGMAVLGQLPYKISYGLLLLLALPGLYLTRASWRALVPLYLAMLAYAAVPLTYFVATRYRTPIEALLVPFAVATLAALMDRRGSRSRRAAPARL